MIYNIFISHSWTYSDAYERLVALLDKDPCFNYRNYSVPKNDPVHTAGSDFQLREAIRTKIQPTSCVLILAGVYSSYSKWIDKEIQMAKEMNKKIIAIQPWDAEKTSVKVKDAADIVVGWNTSSIVGAIRK